MRPALTLAALTPLECALVSILSGLLVGLCTELGRRLARAFLDARTPASAPSPPVTLTAPLTEPLTAEHFLDLMERQLRVRSRALRRLPDDPRKDCA